MAKILLLVACIGCLAATTCAQSSTDRSYFKIYHSPDDQAADTLWVVRSEIEYAVLWRGDTITTGWSYSAPSSFISAIGVLGYDNTFVVKSHMGDGCPFEYQILAIKEDGSYFISDYMGNCEEIARVDMVWPTINIHFVGNEEIGRTPHLYTYNAELYIVTDVK
jgi:hypothetical protein